MLKSEKAAFIIQQLEFYFPSPEIPLKHWDAYTLLVSVLLSAQCTDERVNKITPILFEKADNPFSMQKLSAKALEDIIRPCGLGPAKSKAIVQLSSILVEKHDGKVPANFADLEALPGVGHKTASVVMSQAFHVPAFPVDTHIHRLAYRWGISNGKSVVQTERDLKKLFPENTWNKLHLQIIYFGRSYCPARGHVIDACPICKVLNKKGDKFLSP
ncbi:MAG: endonuclease III domain-containing protein [Chitinophagales bacterium]